MIVAGGYYREVCVSLQQDNKFGSGGRAALAIALAGSDVDWHYYCPELEQKAAQIALSSPNLRHHPYTSDAMVQFTYFHPLSQPEYAPPILSKCRDIKIEGRHILRFGFMEGDSVVRGEKVVYDPQSPGKRVSFKGNGSTAKSLAIVLNAQEVCAFGDDDEEVEAVRNIHGTENAVVILVKSGPQGCRVYFEGEFKKTVPPYRTEKVYKIGSGDVFSAAFAYHWAENGLPPEDAADVASRCVASYCNSLVPSVLPNDEMAALEPIVLKNSRAKVYIAGPFFTMAELWLVEQSLRPSRSFITTRSIFS